MATKLETTAKYLIKLYKEENPTSGYIIVNNNQDFNYQTFSELKQHARKYKIKSFHVKDIITIDNELVVNYHYGIKKSKKKGCITSQDKTGIFKILFSDNTCMYYAKYVSGAGKSSAIEGLFATEQNVWYNFLGLLEKKKKKDATPKVGIYRVRIDPMGGLRYDAMEELQETPVVHQTTQELVKDMEYFYDKTYLFTRYGMPGVRKVILVGEPGTGKTSICIRLSKKYQQTKCVAFCTDIAAAAAHLKKCAQYKISTLLIIEDAESTLGSAGSNVLNFLDGVDQPKNPKGAYVIMTTNFPQRIEPRIIKRPGRIDRIFKFGTLEIQQAIACANIYFKDVLLIGQPQENMTPENKKLLIKNNVGMKKILLNNNKGMTGAQIKELAQSSMALAVSQAQEVVTIEMVVTTKERMEKDLVDVYEFAKEDSMNKGYIGYKITEKPILETQQDDNWEQHLF